MASGPDSGGGARRALPRRRGNLARTVLLFTGVLLAAILVAAIAIWPALKDQAASAVATPARAASPASTPSPGPTAGIASSPAPATRLRLMSYNILTSDPVIYGRNPHIPRRELAFPARVPGIVAQIASADPDIIAIQENFGDPHPYDLLRRRLDDYAWVRPEEQVSILVRRARFTVLESGYRRLHKTEKGFLSWAKVQDRSTGQLLWVFDVHLRAGSSRAEALIRSAETDTVRAQLLKLNPGMAEPVVLMGDLNAAATEKRAIYADPVVKLNGGGLVDAARIASVDISNVPKADSVHGFRATLGGRSYPKVVPQTGKRFDFVFVPKDARVFSFGVLTGPEVVREKLGSRRVYRWHGIVPSDHSPVVADLELVDR